MQYSTVLLTVIYSTQIILSDFDLLINQHYLFREEKKANFVISEWLDLLQQTQQELGTLNLIWKSK